MSRWWNELVAAVADVTGLPLLILLLIGTATLVAALWYWYPAWIPRRWPCPRRPRWRRRGWQWPKPRWPHWRWPTWAWPKLRWAHWRELWRRWRRRRAEEPPEEPEVPEVPEPVAGAELPDLSAAAFASLADRLAAQGRYAEAVRERLRAMVRELVERGVIEHRPGWTVTELAAAAATVRPAVAAPLADATGMFSEIWYGQRPAHIGHDARMRGLAADVHAALGNGAPAVPVPVPLGGPA